MIFLNPLLFRGRPEEAADTVAKAARRSAVRKARRRRAKAKAAAEKAKEEEEAKPQEAEDIKV